jgi:hypothetical protein
MNERMRHEYRYPEHEERRLSIVPARGVGVPHIRQRIVMAAALPMVVVGLVLLISCANVARWRGAGWPTLRLGRDRRVVQIAGVVRASLGRSLTDPPRPAVFVPYSQAYSPELNLIVRTEGDPAALVSPIQREIEQVDDTVPLRGIRTLESQVAETLWPSRCRHPQQFFCG